MAAIDGSLLGPCLVVDVSKAGARLVVQTSAKLPEQFIVVLSRAGQLRRSCSVVWRSVSAVGVKFLTNDWATGKLIGSPGTPAALSL